MISYVMIITLVVTLFILSVIQVIDTNRLYLAFTESMGSSIQHYKNNADMAFKVDGAMNSNGSGQDILSCSGGVIRCQDGMAPSCSTIWISTPDHISDVCNDDNYQGSYSTGNISGLLSADSKVSDDDDLARRRSLGFLPPVSTKQIFALNSDIKQAILLNTNNTGSSSLLPSAASGFTLDGIFSATGMHIMLYQLDRSAYDSSKIVSLLHTFSGTVLTLTGNLMSDGNFSQTGTPFYFDIGLYDFAMMADNPANTPISYDIGATTSLGKPVYIIPLNDSITPKTLLVPDYRYYDGEFIYRSQVLRE
ncbi:MAG: hypothetical protein PHH70_01745 [Candidatus Gracilibacteria bacterium]|nr:hypothetical protein [Candidatus Gracilibacteria bacterium]